MPWSLASAAVSAYGVHQQNKNIDKQLAAQSRENSLNRKYNLKLAMLQNKWNRQQWQMENAYNSPSAQIQRMRAAGLNPDMMYGGGVSGNLSASSPSMTSGAPSSPMDFTALGSKRTVSDIDIHDILQQELTRAQINKVESETEGQNIDNDIRDFEREIVEVMREDGYQGTFATARAKMAEYDAKLSEQNWHNERKKFEFIEEQLRHDKVVNEFEESLNNERRDQFRALVRQAVASANIAEFVDQMKSLDFWTDKGIQALEAVVGAIGAAKGFKVPPTEYIHEIGPKGETFRKTSYGK